MTDMTVQQKKGIEWCGHLLLELGSCEEPQCSGCFAGGILVHAIAAECFNCSDKDGDLESASVYTLRAEYDQELPSVAMMEQSKIAPMVSQGSHRERRRRAHCNGFEGTATSSSIRERGLFFTFNALQKQFVNAVTLLSVMRFWPILVTPVVLYFESNGLCL